MEVEAVREGVKIQDNVTVTLTNVKTGAKRSFSSHNSSINYALSAIAQWIAGRNNVGYQPVYPPSRCSLGSGTGTPAKTDTGLFAAIANAVASLSYANANQPTSGTTTFVFQFPAGLVATQVTEALMSDVNGNPWFHTMFDAPFTPSADENITVQWETTFN